MAVKRMTVGSSLIAAAGLATALVFTLLSGLDYRAQEEQGREAGYAPEWIVIGTYAGSQCSPSASSW